MNDAAPVSRRAPARPRAGLIEAAIALGTLTASGPVLSAIAAGGARLRAAALCTVRLRDAQGAPLRLVASAGPRPVAGDLDGDVAALVAAAARPVVIPRVSHDRRVACAEAWRAHGYTSWLGVPLPAGDAPLGVLGVALPDGGAPPSREERRLLELYAAQAGLAIRNERLAQTVTRQLAALETARAELIETAKVLALGQLVGGVAHEVNNVLGSVALTIEALLEQTPDPDLQARVRALDGQYRQIADLIGELGRFGGGAATGPIDVEAALARVLRLRQPRLTSRGIAVERVFAGNLPPVRGRAAVERAALALVLHCEERVSAGGGRLSLRTESVTRDGARWIAFEVGDDGPTVEPAVLAQLFDPFAPSDGVRGRVAGLAAAHAAVTDLGGRLEAESRGGGLRYRVELPTA